jgi:hypothetical protein
MISLCILNFSTVESRRDVNELNGFVSYSSLIPRLVGGTEVRNEKFQSG